MCPPQLKPPHNRKRDVLLRNPAWVDWYAGHITDPVTRLRFLQKVAPRLRFTLYLRRWRWAILACATVLAGVPAAYHWRLLSTPDKPLQPAVFRIPPAPLLDSNTPAAAPPDVWQVEKSGNSEVYSNGLRIDDRFTVANHPRAYLVFPIDGTAGAEGIRRTQPAGIVFHTTESRQAPFEADQNRVLKKIGESLLEYVRRKRAYNFLIDRFGRVYRVVAETDAANHAGYSVWADDHWLYINLNQSFIGVSIEAQTQPGQEEASMSPAQVRAAAMLTEMLGSRYHIEAGNCVTHAQVSVNPDNRQIGYHTDWASSFPFTQLGLPDNYARPLPSLYAFGFDYNPEFLHWAGNRIEAGLQLSEERLNQEAAAAGMPLKSYRRSLQKRYRQWLEEVKQANADQDNESE